MANTVRRLAAAALSALSVVVLTACGSGGTGAQAAPSLVPGATPGGKLTIGIPFDEPGIGLRTGDTYSGFDVDTARYVAQALGVPPANITWTQANGADREQLLTSGTADLIVSTYTITEVRKQVVDFAGPYFVAHQDLLVRRNDTEITGPETLNGKVLCTVPGTTSADNVLKRYEGRIQLRQLAHYSDCVQALADSQVDAVTTDDVILAGYAADPRYRGVLKVVGEGFSDESYGIGLKKGDTALRTKVDDALKQYVSSGAWRRALDQTVAPSGYTIPDPPNPGSD